jgi:predicted phosphodiesterase
MWAVISDMHANLEATERVLADIRETGITEIICLGDLVGYGPNPEECVEIAKGFKVVLKGNHDEAVINEALGFNPVARDAVDWTRARLKPGLFGSRKRKSRWEFLESLPLAYTQNGTCFVHGSPRDPTMEYVLRSDCEDILGGVSPKISDLFSRFGHVCFVGHTHDPGIITDEGKFLSPREFDGVWHMAMGEKALVNVGSVGQPRDGDNRACYVTYDGETISYRRVEYDFAKTRGKIVSHPELDPRIGERLIVGR